MSEKPKDEEFCPNCLATEVSFNVLHEFTDECPEVVMAYGSWMTLRFIIEEEIKQALGVPTEEPADDGEKPTVQ